MQPSIYKCPDIETNLFLRHICHSPTVSQYHFLLIGLSELYYMPDLEPLAVERELVFVVEGKLETAAVCELHHALTASLHPGEVHVARLRPESQFVKFISIIYCKIGYQ